jgi:hypothetical protein
MVREIFMPRPFSHPQFSRRLAIQAGGIGLLGLGMNHVAGLRALARETLSPARESHRAVIHLFLSGGLTQHVRGGTVVGEPPGLSRRFRV